ncbi:protein of unknown function [Cupriavidus taiwanensis]|uniref:Uncharacterized protein n=2 Tax=Burkholderiaceae TaxID=119060 RepID=A0A142JMW0_9BURK|nr:hypothetical protein A2G96_17690 [Cupriavidus nantongensis]SPA50576.1 protein of unknown function [Cupriavidus taiwanensis]
MIASGSESDKPGHVPTNLPTVAMPVPVGPNDTAAQREWEHFQVAKGIERYRRSLVRTKRDGSTVAKGLEETTPGHRIATELIGPMVAAVQEAQKGYAGALQDPKLCKLPVEMTVLSMLPAETIAACAVLTALAVGNEASYTSVRVNCALRIRHELEYQEWRRAEAEKEAERKELGEDGINMFKLMLHRNKGEVNKKVFDKWSKKAGTLIKLEWTHAQKIQVGAAVMDLLVGSNGWFQVWLKSEGGSKHPKTMFGMTETALALTSALGAQCELQRPFMAPMICEPADYEFIADQPADK